MSNLIIRDFVRVVRPDGTTERVVQPANDTPGASTIQSWVTAHSNGSTSVVDEDLDEEEAIARAIAMSMEQAQNDEQK